MNFQFFESFYAGNCIEIGHKIYFASLVREVACVALFLFILIGNRRAVEELINELPNFFGIFNINSKYAWLGKSWLKSFLSSVDSQKVFLRSALCPQITMVPTQLSICLLFVPRNPHNRVFKISSSSTHTIVLNGRNEHCPHSLGDKEVRAQQ